VFDNWAKLQSGLLLRNVRNDGIFTECVRFRHKTSSAEVGLITGQHCTLSIRSTFNGVLGKGDDFSWSDM
jgi:Nose resistant-to-fluoxetine protein, N-terminal domain